MTTLLLLLLCAPPSPTLTVEVTGFRSSAGHALARLYLPGMDVTKTPARTVAAPILEGRAHFELESLAWGDYALVVVHDENDNGEIDHGVLGLPREPLGFSGGFRLGLFSGLPTFEKLRFAFSERALRVALEVR